MSHSDTRLDEALQAWDSGAPQPPALVDALSRAEGHGMMMAVRARRETAGERVVGWKIGQTSPTMRAERGETWPAAGFLLESLAQSSPGRLAVGDGGAWFIEPELALVVGEPLRGPGISAERVQGSIAQVCSAFELVHRRPGWTDRTLQRAVNGSTAGHVLGTPVAGCPRADALDALLVSVGCDGVEHTRVRGGEVNDNPLHSAAWLVNFLAEFDQSISAGEVILTGTYAGLLAVRSGQRWSAQVGDLPAVILQVA